MFWNSLEFALTGLFPEMADQISEVGNRSVGSSEPSRSRVLVVDADPEFGKLLSSRLAKRGVEMLYAADAQHGLRIASKDQPSVIVAAYDMPNGDAQYLLSKLRTTPETLNIPVFVLSETRLDQGGATGSRQGDLRTSRRRADFAKIDRYAGTSRGAAEILRFR